MVPPKQGSLPLPRLATQRQHETLQREGFGGGLAVGPQALEHRSLAHDAGVETQTPPPQKAVRHSLHHPHFLQLPLPNLHKVAYAQKHPSLGTSKPRRTTAGRVR